MRPQPELRRELDVPDCHWTVWAGLQLQVEGNGGLGCSAVLQGAGRCAQERARQLLRMEAGCQWLPERDLEASGVGAPHA